MGKGSGSTRSSSAAAPKGLGSTDLTSLRGLGAIRSRIVEAIDAGGANWSNPRLVELRSQEEIAMADALDKMAGKRGWTKGFNSIYKDFSEDSPVQTLTISVSTYGSGIENGAYYQVRPGAARVSSNSGYTDEVNALWNNKEQFKDLNEAIKWGNAQANRINRKYKGKI